MRALLYFAAYRVTSLQDTDLGPGWHERRTNEAHTGRLVAQLEHLGISQMHLLASEMLIMRAGSAGGGSVRRRCPVRHEQPPRPGAALGEPAQGRGRDQQASRWRDSTP